MTYIPQENLSITSDIGINSDTGTTGGNWSVNTYTGAGELNDYAYVGVNLQVDEAGTLFFDFSQDGTNWSSYPVAGFDVASGINEVHTAWKGGRYMRPRFIGSGGRSFFRLKTYYSNLPLPLSAPLNQGIGSDQDAQVVRAVSIGEDPAGTYLNNKSDGLGFSTTSVLTSGSTYDSGILSLVGYTQVQTDILSVGANGSTIIEFYEDAGGTNLLRTIVSPYTDGDGFKLLSAPAFTPYVRYQWTATSTGQTQFYFDTKFTTKSISGQILGMTDFIAGGMVANLGRNVVVGQEPDGTFTNQKIDGYAFRTETPLGIGGVYTSPVNSTEGYSQIETHLYADVAGTLVGRWYNDESKTTLIRTFTRPYAGSEVGTVSYFSSPVFGPYVEYEYTNGATGQADFFLDFLNRTKAISGQVLGMNDFIPSGVVANLGRSVIVGQNEAGNFNNVNTDTLNNLNVNISNPRTAFGEIRMAELTPELQVSYVYGINTDIVVTGNTSGGTVSSSDSMAVVTSSASSNAWGEICTKQSIKYAPGQGSVGRFTCLFSDGVTGNTQFIGIIDDEDGFAFGFSGDTFGLLRRQNSSDFFTPQTSWNVDTMDGSSGSLNPSSQLLDPTKGNVFEIKYQYLGFGAITYSIETFSGEFSPVHVEQYANTATVPSIYSPNLPISMRSENTTNTSDITMKSASMAGFVEGKRVLSGPVRSFSNSKAAGTPHTFSIRNSLTFGGRTNKVRIFIQLISTTADGTQPVVVNLLRNASLSAPSWTSIANSPIETDVSNSTITGGSSILSFGLAKVDSKIVQAQQEFSYEVDPGDIITIQTDGSTNAGWSATLSWVEDI